MEKELRPQKIVHGDCTVTGTRTTGSEFGAKVPTALEQVVLEEHIPNRVDYWLAKPRKD